MIVADKHSSLNLDKNGFIISTLVVLKESGKWTVLIIIKIPEHGPIGINIIKLFFFVTDTAAN